MKLNKITFTGIDNTISIEDLDWFIDNFSYIEYGILFSINNQGIKKRYPSFEFIDELVSFIPPHHLSAHLCGSYSRSILNGDILPDLDDFIECFQRFQINAIYNKESINIDRFFHTLEDKFQDKEIIFQLRNDQESDSIFYKAFDYFENKNVKISGLFDQSGGEGKVISDPIMINNKYNVGYAGGIKPDNIQLVLQNIFFNRGHYCAQNNINIISKENINKTFWIDMESGIRSILPGYKDYVDINKMFEICKAYEYISQLKIT